MEYAWLLGVGLLMAAYQAIWWIVIAYLLVGVVLFFIWDNDARPYPKPHWYEFIIVLVITSILWPIAIFTRRYCSGPE